MLIVYLVLILKFYTVPMPLHNVKNQKALSSKYLSIFYRENLISFLNYFTTTLKKGPFLHDAAHIILIFFARLQSNSGLWIDVVCLSDVNIFVNFSISVLGFAF